MNKNFLRNKMTIQEIQEEIISESKILDNWLDKFNYLIKLGKKLPPIDSKHKTEDNLIKDCQSKIWVHSAFKDGKVFYAIDSNSIIIKGIIALLIKVMSNQKPEDIKNADLYHFIDKTGLGDICSRTRINTFWKIVNQMKSEAIKSCK